MEQNYPTLLDRIKSTTIDAVIIIVCMLLITEVLSLFENVPNGVRIALFVLLLMYEPLCTAFGATIGNDKMKIRVRQNGSPAKRINLFQATLRFFFKVLLGWMSFITIFSSPRKRAIHDIVSGSVMVVAE